MLRSKLSAAPFVLLMAFMALTTGRAHAQPGAPKNVEAQNRVRNVKPSDTLAVGMRDGSTFMGRVTSVRGDTAEMATSSGTVRFSVYDVKRSNVVRAIDMVNGEYWFPNPNTTRLLFAPTGRMIRKGDGYFSDYLLFFPGVAVGITDRITIGGGMSIFPTSLDEQLYFVTPKLGVIAREKVNVAVGALIMHAGLGNDDEFSEGGNDTFSIPYVVGTFGGENRSFTTGIGYGYSNGKLSSSPALLFGGEMRVSRRMGLVSENYVFSDAFDGVLVSLGARFFGEKMSGDFGLVRPLGADDSYFFPYIGLVVNFR
jgi:hypothetical protein